MRAYPETRGANPRRGAFWLARLVPCIQVFANVTFVGFLHSQPREWNPVLKGWALRINHEGELFRRKAWSIPLMKFEKL